MDLALGTDSKFRGQLPEFRLINPPLPVATGSIRAPAASNGVWALRPT